MSKKKNKFDRYIRLLTILMSIVLVTYGVYSMHWSFFMVVYSYWFAECIVSVFDRVKYYTVLRRKELSSVARGKEQEGKFLFLFVYWVFIVFIVGFIAAPENTFGENMKVVFFMNKSFNSVLFCVLAGELTRYVHSFVLHRKYHPGVIEVLNNTLPVRTKFMQVSVLLSSFLWLMMYQDYFSLGWSPGGNGELVLLLVLVLIRAVGELIELRRKVLDETKTSL